MEDFQSFIKRPRLSPKTIECLELIPDFPLETTLEIKDVLKEYVIDGIIEKNNKLIGHFSHYVQKINNSFSIINNITQQCKEISKYVQNCKEDTYELTSKMKSLETKKFNLKNNLINVNCIIDEFIISPQEEETLNAGQFETSFFQVISKLEDISQKSLNLPDSNLRNEIIQSNMKKLSNACFLLSKSIEKIVKIGDFCKDCGSDDVENNLKISFSILHRNEQHLNDLWENIANIRREQILLDLIDTMTNISGDSHSLIQNIMNWLESRVDLEIKLFKFCETKSLKEMLNRVTADILQPLKDKIEQYIFSLSDFTSLMKIHQTLRMTLSHFLTINLDLDSCPVKLFKTVKESAELSKNILYNSLNHHCCMLLSGTCPKDFLPSKILTDVVFTFKSVVNQPLSENDILFAGKLIDSAIKVCSITSCDLDKVSCAVYNMNFYLLLREISHFNCEKDEMIADLIDTGVDNLASLQVQFVLENSKLIYFYQLLDKNVSEWELELLPEAINGLENILKNYSAFTYPKFAQINDKKIWVRFIELSLETIFRIYEDIYAVIVKSGEKVDNYFSLTVEQLKKLVEHKYF